MILAAQIALIAFVTFFVLWPLVLYRGDRMWVESREEALRRSIKERKERLYSGVLDLDFDRDSGKISAEDHARMRTELMKDVVAALQDEESLERGGRPRPVAMPTGDAVERMIQQYKQTRHTEAEA